MRGGVVFTFFPHIAEDDLPSLTEQSLLPVGIHDLTLDQVESTFGKFQTSNRRCRLFEKLKAYVSDCKSAGWVIAIIVDGSFVMRCVDEPDDIDLILVLPNNWDWAAELRPFEYNLVSKKMTRRLYGFDVFAVREASEEERNWVEFFAEINAKWTRPPYALPKGSQKGLVRIVP
jgi:hypothetical protein